MPQIINDSVVIDAMAHLSNADPLLAPVITMIGPCTIRPHTDYYRELVEAIIGQQLSVKAAASITKRFLALFSDLSDDASDTFPTPEQILATPVEDMRSAGFSRAKANYIHDLARHILDGKVDFSSFDSLANEAIVSELTAVKGIGEWTAHMFLMFCMGRSDILPYGDLGVRAGIQKLYGLPALPDKASVEAIAANNHWHPYESIASWYMWQSLDNAPKPKI